VLGAMRSIVHRDIVLTGITQWTVVDMDIDWQNVGLQNNLSDMTCPLTKIVEGQTVWWHNTIGISIVVMLY
jgi:hypothetical protein